MVTTRVVLLLLLPLAACGPEEISVRREAKEGAPAAASAAPAPQAGGLRWTAPKGWVEVAGSGMRLASFRLPGAARKAEATVATFPGDVGGELANVNRWRGQIALPPVAAPALDALRERVETAAGAALLYDFTSEGEVRARLVAASLRHGDSTWFFKLTGPEAAVAAARPAFLELVKGLRHAR